MRRFAARLRNFSKSTRLLFLAASIVTLQHKDTIFPVKCWGDDPPYRKLYSISSNNIQIKKQGKQIGTAYLLSGDIFVTASPYVYLSYDFGYTFYCYHGPFMFSHPEVVAKYDNLTFIRIKNTSMYPLKESYVNVFSQVTVFNKREYPSVKTAFLVQNESGYGIIEERLTPGTLVLNDGQIVGLVTRLGSSLLEGYSIVTYWKSIKNVLKRVENNTLNPFIGISVKDNEGTNGPLVMRISSDSPLNRYLHLGDTITKINGEHLRQAMDIQRLIAFSTPPITFTVSYEGRYRSFSLDL